MVTVSAAVGGLPWNAAKVWIETNDLVHHEYVVSRALLLMTSQADKLPLETELVVRDNNAISTVAKRSGALLNW